MLTCWCPGPDAVPKHVSSERSWGQQRDTVRCAVGVSSGGAPAAGDSPAEFSVDVRLPPAAELALYTEVVPLLQHGVTHLGGTDRALSQLPHATPRRADWHTAMQHTTHTGGRSDMCAVALSYCLTIGITGCFSFCARLVGLFFALIPVCSCPTVHVQSVK